MSNKENDIKKEEKKNDNRLLSRILRLFKQGKRKKKPDSSIYPLR